MIQPDLSKATPGPWRYEQGIWYNMRRERKPDPSCWKIFDANDRQVCYCKTEECAVLIVAAVNAFDADREVAAQHGRANELEKAHNKVREVPRLIEGECTSSKS